MFTERRTNTAEQVEEYLSAALAIVDHLDPPAQLREACFTKAVDLFSAKHLIPVQTNGVADLGRGLGR